MENFIVEINERWHKNMKRNLVSDSKEKLQKLKVNRRKTSKFDKLHGLKNTNWRSDRLRTYSRANVS